MNFVTCFIANYELIIIVLTQQTLICDHIKQCQLLPSKDQDKGSRDMENRGTSVVKAWRTEGLRWQGHGEERDKGGRDKVKSHKPCILIAVGFQFGSCFAVAMLF